MLRVPQHERKKINAINSFPFVLSAVEGLLRVFQQPASLEYDRWVDGSLDVLLKEDQAYYKGG